MLRILSLMKVHANDSLLWLIFTSVKPQMFYTCINKLILSLLYYSFPPDERNYEPKIVLGQ